MVDCAKKCISELEEKLESLDECINDVLKLHDKKDEMIHCNNEMFSPRSLCTPSPLNKSCE